MTKLNIVIVGDKEELCTKERPIDYGDMQATYDQLRPSYKKLVDETVKALTENAEHVGYNARQVLDWFKRSGAGPGKLAKALTDTKLYEIFEEDRAAEIDADEDGENVILKVINKFQDTVSPKENTQIQKIITFMYDYYCVSRELVTIGRGEVYQLTDTYLDDFLNDDKFHAWAETNVDPDEHTTLSVIKAYAEYKKVNLTDVLETKYGVIEYSGSYQILNGKKYAPMKNAVDNLILGLYNEQEVGPEFFLSQVAKLKSENN